MDNEQIEAAFSVRGTNYKVRITVRQADVFNVLLLDEDIPDRWSGDFTGSFIEEMTRATGSFKRVSVFWKMLQVAISGTSEEVSLNILSQQDILALQKKSQLSSSSLKPTDDKKYLVITQSTQFDSVKYPLMLVRKPYTNDELCAIIRGLKSENRRLLTRITQPPKQKDEIHSLEMQIYEINNTLKKVTEEKDAIINSLRRKISILEKNIINPQPKNQHLQSGKYDIDVSHVSRVPIVFGLVNQSRYSQILSLPGLDADDFCYRNYTFSKIQARVDGNGSYCLNGTIESEGVYAIFYYICPKQGDNRKVSLYLNLDFSNPGSTLDYRKKPLLYILPIFLVLFVAVLVVWLVNWFMNFGSKIYIHYFFTGCFALCVVSKLINTIGIYHEKSHHNSTGMTTASIIFQLFFQIALFLDIILAAKGWCIIRSSIKFSSLALSLLYTALMLVFYTFLSYTSFGNWDILIVLGLVVFLALYFRDLAKSISNSSLRILAHLLSITNRGINPKTTPVWQKHKMYHQLQITFVVYSILIVVKIFTLFFADYYLWVDQTMSNLSDLVIVAMICYIFLLRKENANGYTMIFDDENAADNGNEYALQDLEGVNFNSEQFSKGGITWTPGMELPSQPRVVETPSVITLESPDGTAEVEVQPGN
ncbi:hypothetical protein GPJ56_007465 [Histomonas meleagridis]|uniref:uncharacterized protein n=1 Tax=Histomonas meleagridis TaxID=135588 RepID=UPI00355988DB|nr:hypothetical protein GPJ56_007465 [Histomonas meleagridis]KAH0804311.1 hypothetical protein GO595_003141 [Histomonas meleagridis]